MLDAGIIAKFRASGRPVKKEKTACTFFENLVAFVLYCDGVFAVLQATLGHLALAPSLE
jgi:hypothetical protein